MTRHSDDRLLHYRLLEKLGEGGMGVVWKALDESLGREVAIKVLPAAVSADAERLARFEREARLLASLSHPNIATIHGLHDADGTRFIVMEYVRGEDLSVRLRRGPLPVDEALVVARRIAEALEAAHEQGVVHRDLKPANVVVNDEDVQVLDFGLAKALMPEPPSGSGAALSASPTITSAQTRDGMILGTAAYMSPEQARGKAVDRRADIWAFGCVLYEALTARAAFPGETVSDTLVAVLSGEPDWDALPAGTPPVVRRLLRRCLAKDARRRLRDIGEARVALEDAIAGSAEPDAPATSAQTVAATASGGPRPVFWALLAVVAAATFAAGWLLRPGAPDGDGVADDRSIRRLTFESGLEQEPALSPDGNYVAYASDRAGNLDIEILPLGGGSVTRVTTDAADDAQPRWSPDGTRLAFVSGRDHDDGFLISAGALGAASVFVSSEGGDIFLIPAFGGPVTKLIDRGAYPTWSPDGASIAFQSNRDGTWRIWRVPVAGGAPAQVTTDPGPTTYHFHPAWSPDGRFIAYGSHHPEAGRQLLVVPADGGAPILVYDGAAFAPAWSADGSSLYFSSNRTAAEGVLNVWRVPFDPDADPMTRPRRVTFGTGSDIGASPSAGDRTIAFSNVRFAPDLWSLDVRTGQLRQITTTDGLEDYPHLHPDGRRLLFESDRTGTLKLWVMDLATGDLEPVTTPGVAGLSRWSPDGARIAYGGADGADGTGERMVSIQRWGDAARTTIDGPGGLASTGLQWSPDGTRLVGADDRTLWLLVPGGESRVLVDNGAFGTWSPDGREIAYQRDAGSDHRELWIVPAKGGEPRVLVGGEVHLSHPQWHPTDPDRILVVIDHLDLGMVYVGTGAVERITSLASSTVLVDYPSWSADGETVYFSLARKRGDLYLIEQ